MAATASIKVTKSSPYKGGFKTWSNRYHFTNSAPVDGTHWTALSDAIVTAEKACLHTYSTIVSTTGYAAGSDVPVFTGSYSTAGTKTISGSEEPAPLQTAALIRYATAARTTKNHPVYLFNYMHDPVTDPSVTHESVSASQITAYNTYAAAWIAGFSDGTVTHVRAGPNGASATGYLVEPYVTHRDFPR